MVKRRRRLGLQQPTGGDEVLHGEAEGGLAGGAQQIGRGGERLRIMLDAPVGPELPLHPLPQGCGERGDRAGGIGTGGQLAHLAQHRHRKAGGHILRPAGGEGMALLHRRHQAGEAGPGGILRLLGEKDRRGEAEGGERADRREGAVGDGQDDGVGARRHLETVHDPARHEADGWRAKVQAVFLDEIASAATHPIGDLAHLVMGVRLHLTLVKVSPRHDPLHMQEAHRHALIGLAIEREARHEVSHDPSPLRF